MAPWSDGAKKGESGFADRYLLTITGAKFTFPYKNAADVCALVLEGERNVNGELDDGHLWLSVGDFEPGDGEGTFALHTSQDESKHFNRRSKIGKFLKSAGEVGLMDVLEKRQDPARSQYEEKDALMWIGLTLDIEEVEMSYGKNKETGEQMEGRQPFVRGFSEAGQPAPVQGGAETAQAAPAASQTTNGSVTKEQATLLAKSADNYVAYLETITGQGVDPGNELAQQKFFDEARSS